MALEQQAEKLLAALSRWRHIWTKTVTRLSDEERKWLGVAQHIHGLEHLSRRIIEVATSPCSASSQYLRRVPSTSASALHAFIRDHVPGTLPAEV